VTSGPAFSTPDEAKAETRKRSVESPQPGNNWRPRPPTILILTWLARQANDSALK
jgi:hypothetical protein